MGREASTLEARVALHVTLLASLLVGVLWHARRFCRLFADGGGVEPSKEENGGNFPRKHEHVMLLVGENVNG